LAFLFVDISLRPAAVRTLAHSRGATDQTSRSSFFDHILEEGFVYKDIVCTCSDFGFNIGKTGISAIPDLGTWRA